jgi:hypothetical protein
MFGAYEAWGLLGAQAPISKDYLLLQNNPKFTKPITQKKIKQIKNKKIENCLRFLK